MRLLLDTHAFLWFVEYNQNLSAQALGLVKAGSNEVFLSIASPWKIAIKVKLGKLQLRLPFEDFIQGQLELNRIHLLNINISHLAMLTTLPLHHRDPFDRLLIAQSIVEQIPIVSTDTAFDAYNVTRIW